MTTERNVLGYITYEALVLRRKKVWGPGSQHARESTVGGISDLKLGGQWASLSQWCGRGQSDGGRRGTDIQGHMRSQRAELEWPLGRAPAPSSPMQAAGLARPWVCHENGAHRVVGAVEESRGP